MDHGISTSLNNTRLVRLLSNFDNLGIKNAQAQFAENFGQMLHFSSAISLLRSLNDDYASGFKPSGMSAEKIRNTFFYGQADIVRFIAAGFTSASRRLDGQLPTAQSLHAHCELTGVFPAINKRIYQKRTTIYEPFRKFYIRRQSDLESKVHCLRSEIREAISGLSPALAKLAGIDQALSESIFDASSELFAGIPDLLGKRFCQFFDIHGEKIPQNPDVTDFEQWLKPGGWLSAFCLEMRELLFAELDIRLQPVLGMIEALAPTAASINQK